MSGLDFGVAFSGVASRVGSEVLLMMSGLAVLLAIGVGIRWSINVVRQSMSYHAAIEYGGEPEDYDSFRW